jgi:hypothetical protein
LPRIIRRQNPARQQPRNLSGFVTASSHASRSAAAQRRSAFAAASFRSAPPGRSASTFRYRA